MTTATQTYDYAPRYRPPGFATLPHGWELIERGTKEGARFPARVDLPAGNHPFGVIRYDRRLTDAEVEDFQLDRV